MKYLSFLMTLALMAPIAADAAVSSQPLAARDPAAIDMVDQPLRIPAAMDREISLTSGVKIKAKHSLLTLTNPDGTSTVIDPSDPALAHIPTPIAHTFDNCANLMRWMDTHKINNRWRAICVWYMEEC